MIEVELDLVLEADYDPLTGEYCGMTVFLEDECIDRFIKNEFRDFLDRIAEEACIQRYKHGMEDV